MHLGMHASQPAGRETKPRKGSPGPDGQLAAIVFDGEQRSSQVWSASTLMRKTTLVHGARVEYANMSQDSALAMTTLHTCGNVKVGWQNWLAVLRTSINYVFFCELDTGCSCLLPQRDVWILDVRVCFLKDVFGYWMFVFASVGSAY